MARLVATCGWVLPLTLIAVRSIRKSALVTWSPERSRLGRTAILGLLPGGLTLSPPGAPVPGPGPPPGCVR